MNNSFLSEEPLYNSIHRLFPLILLLIESDCLDSVASPKYCHNQVISRFLLRVKLQLALKQNRFICRCFSVNTVNVFSLPYDVLNIFLSQAHLIVRMPYVIFMYNKILKYCINCLFFLLVRFSVNNRLWVVNFWGSEKLYRDFQPCMGWGKSVPLTPA